MASRELDTVDVSGALTLREVWSNGTQPGDPPEGYTATDGAGAVLTERDLSDDEAQQLADLDAATLASTNGATLQDRLTAAVTANTAYLAVKSPTTAQTTTQVQRLSRQTNALIRLVLNQLTTTDGT